MSERPLHVRVAEALGCRPTEIRYRDDSDSWWQCHCPSSQHNYRDDSPVDGMLLDYDTDWSAGGPLIERFHMHVGEQITYGDSDTLYAECWIAGTWDSAEGCVPEEDYLCGRGPSPLLAVCHLVLALAEAGKLEPR